MVQQAASQAAEAAEREARWLTMDSVADPAPALASTTSVPAFWMRSVSFATSASVNVTGGLVCTTRSHAHCGLPPLPLHLLLSAQGINGKITQLWQMHVLQESSCELCEP